MASDGPSPHSPSLRLGLPAPHPSRRHHAQSLLAPHFMTQERIMFSNPTTSKLRLSPAATPSAFTPPLHSTACTQGTLRFHTTLYHSAIALAGLGALTLELEIGLPPNLQKGNKKNPSTTKNTKTIYSEKRENPKICS